MAKKVINVVKLQIPAGAATPAPPVGPALGQAGINIVGFTKDFNARTADQKGMIIPVVITVYEDRSFEFINTKKVGKVTKDQVKEIAETKMKDLNAADIEAAMRMIEGTARSMGFTVED